MVRKSILSWAAVATMALVSMPAGATALLNGDFETGDLTGWSIVGGSPVTVEMDIVGGFGPYGGTYYAAVAGGEADVATKLWQTFTMGVGDTVKGAVGFRANDSTEEVFANDSGYLIMFPFGGGLNLLDLQFDVVSVGNNSSTGWFEFSYTALVAGDYTLEVGSTNIYDDTVDSYTMLDQVELVPAPPPTEPAVPEPAAWAMMIAGFGAVGAAMRRRRIGVRAVA